MICISHEPTAKIFEPTFLAASSLLVALTIELVDKSLLLSEAKILLLLDTGLLSTD
jgi:hypothetical protein